ncbi:hypothetical protein I3843_03G245200 [Carya illinoinensis]|nr:hypothetical protein I3843_03G245200 [Carya illinoinensis]
MDSYAAFFSMLYSIKPNNQHTDILWWIPTGIVTRDEIIGLYWGFVPNALKTLPSSRFGLIAVSFHTECNLGFFFLS